MKSKRMAIAVPVISCVAAATISAASAQETTAPRAGANHVVATDPGNTRNTVPRQGGTHLTARGRMSETTMHERGQLTRDRAVMGERPSGRFVSGNRYSRDWQDDRGDFGRGRPYSGGWRGDRDADVGAASPEYGPDRGYYSAQVYGYPSSPRNAYGPSYDVPYGAPRYYDYAPEIGVGIGPFGIGIDPAWGW
jgi:hypothetical protein